MPTSGSTGTARSLGSAHKVTPSDPIALQRIALELYAGFQHILSRKTFVATRWRASLSMTKAVLSMKPVQSEKDELVIVKRSAVTNQSFIINSSNHERLAARICFRLRIFRCAK